MVGLGWFIAISRLLIHGEYSWLVKLTAMLLANGSVEYEKNMNQGHFPEIKILEKY